MKKIKIFLGGYINERNTQNLNCLALAEFLDNNKFEIYALKKSQGEININYLKNQCQLFTYNKKLGFTKLWNYIQALYYCDILYLPKRENLTAILFFNKFFQKKLFLTIEGIIDNYVVDKLEKKKKNGFQRFLNLTNQVENIYSITKYMKEYNETKVGLKSKSTILYLGVNNQQFTPKAKISNKLKNIIFIGNDMKRKGIHEYIKLAEIYPSLTFHIVGEGNSINIEAISNQYPNINYHGVLPPSKLNKLLQTIDLHILPSKSEGFPKVILETASVGIPSMLYGTYGASEWIKSDENGFIIENFQEFQIKINELNNIDQLLYKNAINALKLADNFNWSNIVNIWETEIVTIVNDKGDNT